MLINNLYRCFMYDISVALKIVAINAISRTGWPIDVLTTSDLHLYLSQFYNTCT